VVERIFRKKQLPAVTGLERSAIGELIENGEFPPPIPLGPRSIGWLESEIEAWQQKRKAARDEGRADRSGLSGTAKIHYHQTRTRAGR
jgi:prophage regulatory protein